MKFWDLAFLLAPQHNLVLSHALLLFAGPYFYTFRIRMAKVIYARNLFSCSETGSECFRLS